MAIIRWNPWNFQDVMSNDWDLPTIPALSRFMGQGLNIYETDDAIIAEAAVPGISEDNIDITIDDGIIRITGTASEKKEDKNKRKYYMSSMNTAFNYSFRLPEGALADTEPLCELNDGVITLRFPKAQKTPPKKVKVTKKGKEKK